MLIKYLLTKKKSAEIEPLTSSLDKIRYNERISGYEEY